MLHKRYLPIAIFLILLTLSPLSFALRMSVSYPKIVQVGDTMTIVLSLTNDEMENLTLDLALVLPEGFSSEKREYKLSIARGESEELYIPVSVRSPPGEYSLGFRIETEDGRTAERFVVIDVRRSPPSSKLKELLVIVILVLIYYGGYWFFTGAEPRKVLRELGETLLIVFGVYIFVTVVLTTALRTPTPIVTVVSNSMVPTFSRGDILFVRGADNYTIGDIIVYRAPGKSVPIIHRIIGIREDGTYIVKGDANPYPDPYPVRKEWILGKVIEINGRPLVIPKLGYIKLILFGM